MMGSMMRRAMIGDGSTLWIDFTTGVLDSRLTFTRAANTATVINSSGLVQTVNANIPRFDHDPTTLAPRGLLIEGAATNLCLNGSMAYTATAPTNWARGFSGCTVASVNSTTFSGEKAWSISATASGQRDLLEQVISLAANTTYTVSVYLEAVTGTTATFAYMTSLPSGATSNTVVNPSSGRVSFTVTVGATAGNGTLRIGIGSATGTGVSADASVRFSHVQVEAGSSASSYIPTVASTVTRVADTAIIAAGSAFTSWYTGDTSGTFYANWHGGVRSTTGTNRTVFSTSDVVNRHFHMMQTAAAGNLRVSDFGASTSVTTANSMTSGAQTKGAFSFNLGNVKLCLNGGTVASGSVVFTTAPTWLVIGGTSTNGTSITDANVLLNGCVRQIKYWPTILTDAQLQSFTT
jgi:hypothetical protein